MMMPRQLNEYLFTAGNRLADPPSSAAELLPLLDLVAACLAKVDQVPLVAMDDEFRSLLRSLVANNLLHHPNSDVRVAVASCIIEFTRITAPDGPYDDDQLTEVFQLIVSSFANLSDTSSRSYAQRVSILEMVSKIRLCVVILDLELDTLIVEMFELFLKEIRDYHHHDSVFLTMETIMTLVIEESEDITHELLSPILATLKNDDKEVLPIARELGESVLESCAAKVKPYLLQAIESSRISIDDYSPVIASVCELETSCVVDPIDCPTTPKEPLVYHKSIKDDAGPSRKRPCTWAADASGHEEGKTLESESGNVSSSSSPSVSLLLQGHARMAEFEDQLVKFKVELEENQKRYDDLVAARDGLKKFLSTFS